MCEINYERILESYGTHNRSLTPLTMIARLKEVPLMSIQHQELTLLARKKTIAKHEKLYIFRLYFDNVLNTKR